MYVKFFFAWFDWWIITSFTFSWFFLFIVFFYVVITIKKPAHCVINVYNINRYAFATSILIKLIVSFFYESFVFFMTTLLILDNLFLRLYKEHVIKVIGTINLLTVWSYHQISIGDRLSNWRIYRCFRFCDVNLCPCVTGMIFGIFFKRRSSKYPGCNSWWL